jgi:hypothetical protein
VLIVVRLFTSELLITGVVKKYQYSLLSPDFTSVLASSQTCHLLRYM